MFNVLIIDDDKERSERIKSELIKLNLNGHQVVQSFSMLEGEEELKRIHFDVVIIDVVLPKRKGDRRCVDDGGIKLLEKIKRREKYKEPNRVIGITSNLTKHDEYRARFERLCEIVIPVEFNSITWLETIIEDVEYRLKEKLGRDFINTEVALVTIHGIRTFGEWQERVFNLLYEKNNNVSRLNYEYGYFSSLSFLIPPLRKKAVDNLYKQLVEWLSEHDAKKFYLVAHSFGTYILAEAIERIIKDNRSINIECVILCGSVLKSSYDWNRVRGSRNFKIINECGTNDFILWLSNVFALGLGMAGKTGFNWINSDLQLNRYHLGGHSLYFEYKGTPSNNFIEDNWLPILFNGDKPKAIDARKNNFIHHGILEIFVRFLGYTFYPVACLSAMYMLYQWWLS